MNTRVGKVAILGLGLMGGSLGSALVRKGYQVSGWDHDSAVGPEALRIGAINAVSQSLEGVVAGAEVIFVATPVAAIPEMIGQCLPYVDPGTIFTDLGSIKEKIIAEVAAILPKGCFFVPGHPMTGSEKNSIGAADPYLFENAAYILIRDAQIPPSIAEKVDCLVVETGAQVIHLTASEHDRIVGMVSHLPHLVAAALARTAGTAEASHPGTLALAAGGFRDTTRIAMGFPSLWEGIVRGNRGKVLDALDAFEVQLRQLKAAIAEDDPALLQRFLEEARETRIQIPAKNKGFLSLLHEMVVTIADRPGAIEEVLRCLSQARINIKDIEILRVREGEGGTLRLALENRESVDDAVAVLSQHGFKAWRR